MAPTITTNDGVLVISLIYLSIDMQYQMHEFEGCHWPVHRWLLISYFFILAFRFAHIVGSMWSEEESGDFLLNLRHKDSLPRLLASLTWLLVLPFFAFWTMLGSYWVWDSKRASERCLPMGYPLCFIVLWQMMSYAWLLIHCGLGGIAWFLERKLRHTEHNLRALEDADTLSRWGQVSQLSGYTALVNNEMKGLTPDQINRLPEAQAGTIDLDTTTTTLECSICLTEIDHDDVVRQLDGCGHCFHRSCIDLWLLRRADCPLCKTNVVVDDGIGASPSDGRLWSVAV